MAVFELGTLNKGDPCVVRFESGMAPWVCRVVSSWTKDGLALMYECMTAHGSTVMAGSAWVSPAQASEVATLLQHESLARQRGIPLYGGRLKKVLLDGQVPAPSNSDANKERQEISHSEEFEAG